MQDLGAFDAQEIAQGLLATEFEIAGTQFQVQKLPAMAAWALMEQIRRELGRTSAEVASLGDSKNDFEATEDNPISPATVRLLAQMVLSLEPKFVDDVRKKLFEGVKYRRDDTARTFQQLAGSEDMAFEGHEPLAVYHVLMRCLFVNFSASLRVLVSGVSGLLRNSSPSDPSG